MKWMKLGLAAGGGLIAGGLVLAAVLTAGGAASAQEGPAEGPRQRFHESLADKLGIGADELRALSAEARAEVIDALVDEGKLTAEQAERLKNGGLGHGRHGPGAAVKHLAVNVFETVAELTGLTPEQVRDEHRAGKSFAVIGAEHNVDSQAIVDAIVAAHRQALADAVASGRLTQEQADGIAEGLEERIERMVNSEPGEHPMREVMPRMGMRGMSR